MRRDPSDDLDLKVARHYAAPAVRAPRFGWVQVALGLEQFGRPASVWGSVLTPVPIGAAIALAIRFFGLPAHTWPWLADRLGELAWVCLAPFVVAAFIQAVMLAWSNRVWRESEGDRHIDFSARAWHYVVGVVVAILPLAVLQFSGRALNVYLKLSWLAQSRLYPGQPLHVGYDPDPSNLMVLGMLPIVFWQVRRLLSRIPAGRILAFQRELARLKGAVAWDAKAWTETVGETFERWMADLHPSYLSRERGRRHRLRWMNFHREVVAAYEHQPADLARANRALATYRQGM